MIDTDRKIKVLIAKLGLDTHDRGAKVLTMMLRDFGMEVIYTGILARPDEVIKTAIEEDVDVIGISSLIGEHLLYSKVIMEKLEEKGLRDILVLLGGVIPKQDIPVLKSLGVKDVFIADSMIGDIVKCINENIRSRA
ncbi:MAG: cobalamin-dependent protein [Thermodesulfobacteriota bacterium]|nr:cobalamin-dependent protein [Thermodesulfobacteriota bacterium]